MIDFNIIFADFTDYLSRQFYSDKNRFFANLPKDHKGQSQAAAYVRCRLKRHNIIIDDFTFSNAIKFLKSDHNRG